MDKNKKNSVVAPLLVLVAGILWGTMGIYVRTLTELKFTTILLYGVLLFIKRLCASAFFIISISPGFNG